MNIPCDSQLPPLAQQNTLSNTYQTEDPRSSAIPAAVINSGVTALVATRNCSTGLVHTYSRQYDTQPTLSDTNVHHGVTFDNPHLHNESRNPVQSTTQVIPSTEPGPSNNSVGISNRQPNVETSCIPPYISGQSFPTHSANRIPGGRSMEQPISSTMNLLQNSEMNPQNSHPYTFDTTQDLS